MNRDELFATYKYNCEMLVETGTYKGDGVFAAISAGYKYIVTFEIDENTSNKAADRLAEMNTQRPDVSVTFCIGSSKSKKFKFFVNGLDKPVVFWLDAHLMENRDFTLDRYPLQEEIRVITETKVPHVIMMDDVRLFPRYGLTIEKVKNMIRNEWGSETVFYIASSKEGYPDDVLVAVHPEIHRMS